MQLQELALTNFKNIAEAHLELSPKVNCFTGLNGMGKSNLLDAIHYLSMCRSFAGLTDSQLVRRGETFLTARGVYLRRQVREELTLGITPGRRKSLRRGGKEYKRLTQHIGLFPLVMSAPGDVELIRGAGEERRRWLDMVISQADPLYLDALVRYTKALEQRNSMLREHVVDHTLYEAVEVGLEAAAMVINARRAQFIDTLTPVLQRYYAAIAGDGEMPTLSYRSTMTPGAGMMALLDSARRHDEIVGHTSVGPHRDDIELEVDALPLRRAGSQGQCKTFTIALRLAQFEHLQAITGLRPLLLLDDIFDKLDATRVERIMALVAGDAFGQIFITDTNRDHLDEIIARTSDSSAHRIWTVSRGQFISEPS